MPVFLNDIQRYSSVLAEGYLLSYRSEELSGKEIIEGARPFYEELKSKLPRGVCDADYEETELEKFTQSEIKSRELLNHGFSSTHHLFTKCYSGTWWSVEQCLWIDAVKKFADDRKDEPEHAVILASLMYAMAYCSQGTGHFAQYRDAKDESSLRDILIYRRRSLPDYFVHYSRFYHALETLVLYDYPTIQPKGEGLVKGRYREGRHQSPFSIRSQVRGAFEGLFQGIWTVSYTHLTLPTTPYV